MWQCPENPRLLRLGPCDDEGVRVVDFIEQAPGDRELWLSKQARARVIFEDLGVADVAPQCPVGLAREGLDLKEIKGGYMSGLGQPPFDPHVMVALLLHGYASGLYSSPRIARACRERNDFVMIVALDPPAFRTISDFRKRHLKALGDLFWQVPKLCETVGPVKLGHVALDGTKIKANASKHKGDEL